MFASVLVRFVASLTTQYGASSPKDDSHVKNVEIHPPLFKPVTLLPRLRAQCTLKRGRAHAPLNRRKRLSISQKCET